MACECGRGPWHQLAPGHGCGHGARCGDEEWGCRHGYPSAPEMHRRRRARLEDLESYLADLEEEVAAVRTELDEMRGRSGA